MEHVENLKLNEPPLAGELEQIPFFERVPTDYVEFMKKANGGHGFVGNEHLILFRAHEIAGINEAASVERYAPGLLIFASNGGGQSYAFDFRHDKIAIVKFYDMDIGDEEPEWCADSFEGLLSYLSGQP